MIEIALSGLIGGLPFFYFLFIASVTPGPNNVMLTASGMNFGYYKTLPHILGVMFGFLTLILLCAFGVGAAYEAYPQISVILKVFASVYLLYLAYRIAGAGRLGLRGKKDEVVRPLRFIEAFGLAATSLLPPEQPLLAQSVIVVVATLISSGVSSNSWAIFGQGIARLFRDDKIRRIINIALALLLLGCLPLMLIG